MTQQLLADAESSFFNSHFDPFSVLANKPISRHIHVDLSPTGAHLLISIDKLFDKVQATEANTVGLKGVMAVQ